MIVQTSSSCVVFFPLTTLMRIVETVDIPLREDCVVVFESWPIRLCALGR